MTKKASKLSPPALREKQFAQLLASFGKEPTVAALPTIGPGTTTGYYSGSDLSAPAIRPGADDHKALPSRYMDRLIYSRTAS
jgi:hypothetical protein